MEPNFQSRLGSTGAMEIQSDSQPTAMYDEDGRPGWKYTKMEPSDKLSWKIYSGANETLTCKDVASISFIGSIDVWNNLAHQAPFFTVYTKMKNDGSDAGGWFHSKHSYMLHKDSQLIRKGEKCVFYALGEPSKESGLREIPLRTRDDNGEYDGDNEVQSVSLHSALWGNNFSVYVEKLNLDCKPFLRGVDKTCINIKLLS